jgi:hypothetical protein
MPKIKDSPTHVGNGEVTTMLAPDSYDESPVRTLARVREAMSLSTFRAQADEMFDALGLAPEAVADIASPWQMFAQAIKEQLQGAANWKGIQLLGVPKDADWNDPKYGNYRAWRVLADSLPSYGSEYKPTQISIADSYYAFITNIDIPLPNENDRKEAEKARVDYMDAVTQLSTAYQKLGSNWDSFDQTQQSLPPQRRLTFDQWFAQIGGIPIATAQDKADLAAQKYSSWLTKAFGGFASIANLIPNFTNPAFQLSAESPDGLRLSYHTYNISPDLGYWIEDSKKLVAQGAPPVMTFQLDKNSSELHAEDVHVSGGVSYSFGFFSFGANASYGRSSIDTRSDAFHMKVSVRNMEVFTITPSQWFDGTAVKIFQNGPWIKGGIFDRRLAELWGPNGILGLMPSQVLVVYRPKIEVSMSHQEFSQVQTSFQSSGGLSIGPFGFGASYSRSTNDVHFDASSNTITLEDSSDTPQIMAVISSVLPNFD